MKHSILFALLCAGTVSTTASAQLVNREKYPDYSSELKPDYSLMENNLNSPIARTKGVAAELPDHLDNSKTKFFPPVFNQDAGSCGSASRICYMFTHELNAYRNLDAQDLNNRYPSHFVWLHTFGNSGKEDFVIRVGVPSAKVYGGTTFSQLYGYQEASDPDFGWMQGYDKWYSAMWNRMESTANFPVHVGTEEGRQAVKRWLYNHNGDDSFQCGGIVGIGVASGGDWQPIPSTPTNREIGLVGKKYVAGWGESTDHALTVVGYDDRIEFDINGNGIYGEESADEKGAWIVVNSWSDGWCNNGFIYCPYAMAGPMSTPINKDKHLYKLKSGYWYPEIYKVRKDYRPLRTIKLKMEYSRRSELCLSAGISTDLNAEMPEKTITFDHFKYAGDGKNGNSNPAPEVPMLGRWKDGMHYEPMEFGYDLTDLSAKFDKNMPLKYFFIVETRDWAEGHGKIHNASIIDYEFQKNGIETPFDLNGEGVEIQNKGNKTIISTIVYGETYYAPQNLSLVENTLSWQAPLRSVHKIKGYRIYSDNNLIAEVAADQFSFDATEHIKNTTNFSLSAIYADGKESSKLNVNTPIKPTGNVNFVSQFNNSGFTIHNVFNTKYQNATIEYWLKPSSLKDWNQQAGPGWGTFLLHANSNGSFSLGWSSSSTDRINTAPNTLATNIWKHIAIVVKGKSLKVYVNGEEKGSTVSPNYSGIGGFGDFVFVSNGNNSQSGRYDEIRIWNYARSAEEIKNNYKSEYSGNIVPSGLIAYYKGDIFEVDGKKMMRECINANHATINNKNANQSPDFNLKFEEPSDGMKMEIVAPTSEILKGIPVQFAINHSSAITKLVWTAEGAGVKDLQVKNPTFTFKSAGQQTVSVTGYNKDGETMVKTCTVDVKEAPAPDATFIATAKEIPAGEYVSFNACKPMLGYTYEWSMPGAEVETAANFNASASYQSKGEYTVTLTVTGPDGKSLSTSQKITVVEVAPKSDFEITPNAIVKGETAFLKDLSKFNPNKWQWRITSNSNDVIVVGQNSSWTPTSPGCYDVTLTTSNSTGSDSKTVKHALTVYNANSKNGLNFTGSKSTVEMSKPVTTAGTKSFTIDWWMNPGSNLTQGFGNESNFNIKINKEGAAVVTVGTKDAESSTNYVIPNEWHHYAVIFHNSQLSFYRDAKLYSKRSIRAVKEIPALEKFAIGLASAPFVGQLDEFRVWNSALNRDLLEVYSNAPITDIDKAMKENNLILYYDFNQSSGNVEDRTPNKNDGVRNGFGPEGDAWGLSRGVFSLNFDKMPAGENVSDTYLKNYKSMFEFDSNKNVNPTVSDRFYAIKDWTLENTVVKDGITSGVHVDKKKGNSFTFAAEFDGFSAIADHKAYQTITLPAGNYEFSLNFAQYDKQSGFTYLVAAEGKGLPNTDNLDEAIASTMISGFTNVNQISFILEKETEISLGLVINMHDKERCTINDFKLVRNCTEVINADGANGFDLTIDDSEYSSLFLPYPTVVPENVTAYVASAIEGDQVVLAPINNGIIPAKTGVIVTATAGDYHFAPSTTSSIANSILTGVLEDTPADNSKRYFELDVQKEPGFYLYNSSTLEANRAYLVTDANDAHEFYKLDLTAVGIEEIESENTPNEVYDLSGRRVIKPAKGLYIINGKKVLVK